jgi:hypothetical protein
LPITNQYNKNWREREREREKEERNSLLGHLSVKVLGPLDLFGQIGLIKGPLTIIIYRDQQKIVYANLKHKCVNNFLPRKYYFYIFQVEQCFTNEALIDFIYIYIYIYENNDSPSPKDITFHHLVVFHYFLSFKNKIRWSSTLLHGQSSEMWYLGGGE